jgi:hypothetical protein
LQGRRTASNGRRCGDQLGAQVIGDRGRRGRIGVADLDGEQRAAPGNVDLHTGREFGGRRLQAKVGDDLVQDGACFRDGRIGARQAFGHEKLVVIRVGGGQRLAHDQRGFRLVDLLLQAADHERGPTGEYRRRRDER